MLSKIETIIHLPLGAKIVNQKVVPLTTPGENYSSQILKVDVTFETTTGNEEIDAVAKVLSRNDELAQRLFDTSTALPSEIRFYKHVVPLLDSDLFPKFYGSQLSPDPVLLLENLHTGNYKNVHRLEGFDLDVAKMAIGNLARFHALSLRLKHQKRAIFDNEIKPVLVPWRMDVDYHNRAKKRLAEILGTIPELQHLKDRILVGFDRKLVPHEPREPLATIVHNDYWVNNIMVKVENARPVKTKIIDLQTCTYGSPAKDVLFFLFANVRAAILDQHYDDLLKLYYETCFLILRESVFSFESLEKELEFEARNTQFGHIVYMLFVIFAPEDGTGFTLDGILKMEPTELYRQKLVYIVNDFAKRGWI